jgi:hypothetical protein
MPLFEVTVVEDWTLQTTKLVEAETRESAEELAIELVEAENSELTTSEYMESLSFTGYDVIECFELEGTDE